MVDVDLVGATDAQLIQRLAGDPVLLVDVIYALCKPQADERNITDEEFGRAMWGDVIDHATTAMLEALADFFPSRRRELLQRAIGKVRTMERMTLEAAARTLDSDVMEQLLAKELAPEKLEAELKRLLADATTASAPGG